MEEIIMSDTISSIVSGLPAYQPQPETGKPLATVATPQTDVVTISAQGSQAAQQLRTAGSTPAEEAKESLISKVTEANAGKK
jgi:hypothetical protein